MGKLGKIAIIVIGILLLSRCGGNSETETKQETQITETTVSESNTEPTTESETVPDTEPETTKKKIETEAATEETKIETESSTEETEPPTEAIPPRDHAIGISNKNIADITTTFHDKVPNDATGKWKCLVVDANGSMPEYVLSAYHEYGTDASVFIIEDLTGKQCAVVTDLGDMLDVTIHEYLDKEEQDAKLMAGGNVLAEYWIYKDNGDVVAVEAEPVTEPPTPAPTEPPTVPPTQPPVVPAAAEPEVLRFVLNLETGCVHINAGCSAAEKILPENYAEIEIWDDELVNYAGIYWACGKCSKSYSDELPKF